MKSTLHKSFKVEPLFGNINFSKTMAYVTLSALEIFADGTFYGMKDHITVFFDKEVAERYQQKFLF